MRAPDPTTNHHPKKQQRTHATPPPRRTHATQPLDKLERAELTKQAGAFVEPGFELVMQEKVDKKLIGGFVLEFEDRLVDMSVAKKLEEFNNLVFKLEGDLRA
jgi:hypothetical protein